MSIGPMSSERVVIIGAGLGGLSAALHLAGAGQEVLVLEKNDEPGGLMGSWRHDGYRFDTGPTVLTLPSLIEDCLAAVGETLTDRLSLRQLAPAYLAHFADGSQVRSYADEDQMADEVGAVFGARHAAGYRKLVAYLDELYRLEFDRFMDRNLDGVRDLVSIQALGLVRIGGLRSMEAMTARFIDDDRLRRLFTFQALYAGVSPSAARAIYGVIPYLDSVSGVWYPVGGMHRVARALADAAEDHGVRFRYGTAATRIELLGGRARAVHTADGQRIRADAVICNVDPALAYRDLLPAEATPPRYRPGRRIGAPRYSPSAFVWHVGSNQPLTEPAHHSISFGGSWKNTFREIISGGQLMSDPSLLITSPTVTDPSVAPDGRHTYYVLAPAPNTDTARIDWARVGERYRDELTQVLQRRGLDQHGALSSGIEVSRVMTPDDWAAAGQPAGSPFAAAHTLGQTGPWRHPTRHRSIDNLLFCGAAVQPGVGVPTVLLSGRLAAARLIDARANRPARHLGR